MLNLYTDNSKVVSELITHSFNISKCFQGNIIKVIPQFPVTSSFVKEVVGKLYPVKV